jgi:hypothetical protein
LKDGACPQGHGVKKSEPNAGGAGDSNNDPIPGAEMRTTQNFTDVAKANEHIGVLTTALNDAEGKLDSEIAKSDPVAVIVKGMSPGRAEAYRKMHERNARLETERLNEGYVSKADKILKGAASNDAEGRAAALAVVKTLAGVATDAERATAETFISKLAEQYAKLSEELDGYEVGGAGGNAGGSGEPRGTSGKGGPRADEVGRQADAAPGRVEGAGNRIRSCTTKRPTAGPSEE